ncbi:MAG: VTT domain-containing protein [Prolixibacteraceae bacterium]
MNSIPRLSVLNRYYRITRFYVFLKEILLKTGMAVGIFVPLYLVFDNFILDTQKFFHYIATNFDSLHVFGVFFISEMLMGILPPEIFIAWGLEKFNPWAHMLLLSAFSYVSGIISYWCGVWFYRFPFIKRIADNKFPTFKTNIRKWGGFFIVAGALFPLPFALVSFIAGVVKFRFENYLFWSLFRFARFFLFALIMLRIL